MTVSSTEVTAPGQSQVGVLHSQNGIGNHEYTGIFQNYRFEVKWHPARVVIVWKIMTVGMLSAELLLCVSLSLSLLELNKIQHNN